MDRTLSTIGCAVATLMATTAALAAGPVSISNDRPLGGFAPDAPAVESDGIEPEEETSGLSLGVGFVSAYVFRGSNLLLDRSQHDQHGAVQPSLAYDIASTGLTLAYFASYQVIGENRAELVAEGTGDEQDLTLSWAASIGDVEVGTSIGAYVYPFADAEVAGTRVPTYLEPGVSVSASTVVELGFAASLMAGLQEAIRPSTYVYLAPSVGRRFELTETAALEVASGYGLKLQRETDNTHDVSVDLGVAFRPAPRIDLTPAVHWSWTNLDARSFAQEQLVWASIEMGARL